MVLSERRIKHINVYNTKVMDSEGAGQSEGPIGSVSGEGCVRKARFEARPQIKMHRVRDVRSLLAVHSGGVSKCQGPVGGTDICTAGRRVRDSDTIDRHCFLGAIEVHPDARETVVTSSVIEPNNRSSGSSGETVGLVDSCKQAHGGLDTEMGHSAGRSSGYEGSFGGVEVVERQGL